MASTLQNSTIEKQLGVTYLIVEGVKLANIHHSSPDGGGIRMVTVLRPIS